MYLTYSEYLMYGGSAVDEDGYIVAEFKARSRIDRMTYCRVQDMAEVPEEVKLLMVSLINIGTSSGLEAQAKDPTVTSFTTDGYSETRANALTAASASEQMDRLIRGSLFGVKNDKGVPLLYRGCEA